MWNGRRPRGHAALVRVGRLPRCTRRPSPATMRRNARTSASAGDAPRKSAWVRGGARGSGDRANGGAVARMRGAGGPSARTRRGRDSGSGAAGGRGGAPRRSRSGRACASRADAARHPGPPDALPCAAWTRTGTAPATSAASSSARRNRGRVHARESFTARNLRASGARVQRHAPAGARGSARARRTCASECAAPVARRARRPMHRPGRPGARAAASE